MKLLQSLKLSAILERGRGKVQATAIEYGLIAAGISVAIIAVVNSGPGIAKFFGLH